MTLPQAPPLRRSASLLFPCLTPGSVPPFALRPFVRCPALQVSPLNLGMIASYYYIAYTTIELFASSLQSSTKLKGLMEILSSASEFELLPVRHREDDTLTALALHCPNKLENPKFMEPHAKVNVMLQCHFSRREVGRELAGDLDEVLDKATRLLQVG